MESTLIPPPLVPPQSSLARLTEENTSRDLLLADDKTGAKAERYRSLRQITSLLAQHPYPGANDDTVKALIDDIMLDCPEDDLFDAFSLLFSNDESEEFIPTTVNSRNILNNLLKLKYKKRTALSFQTIFMQSTIYYSESYIKSRESLEKFRGHYQLTFSENIFRHFIGLNAGLGSGSVIYGVATAIFLSVPVMVAAGWASIIACGIIMKYFLNSYSDEDKDLAEELVNHERSIRVLANAEAEMRLRCYRSLIKAKTLINSNHDYDSLANPSAKVKNFYRSTTPADVAEMDDIINELLDNYSAKVSTAAQLNDVKKPTKNSIYTRIFHSKYWGPVLSFFGATGTLFGVTKTILTIAGVTALAGSTVLLPAVVAAAAILISGTFALKHWQFNNKSESRKKILNNFRRKQLQELEIRNDKLKHLFNELQNDNTQMESDLSYQLLQKENPQAARQLDNHIAHSSDTAPRIGNTNGIHQFGVFAPGEHNNDNQFTAPTVTITTPAFGGQ